MRKYSTERARAKELHEALRIERLGVHDGGEDVGEDLELAGHPHVVPIARYAVRNHAVAHLSVGEGLDHRALLRHPPDPPIGLHTHREPRGLRRTGKISVA